MPFLEAGILGGASLLGALGQSIFAGEQAKAKGIQEAISGEGKAQQDIYASAAEKQGKSLQTLIEAYRSALGGQ